MCVTLPPARISRAAACVQEKALVTFASSIVRHALAGMPSSGSTGWMRALLTSASSRPCHAVAAATSSWQARSSVRSAGNTRAAPISSASACAASGERWQCTATALPAAANRSAMPRPMVPLAPVTRVTVPVRSGRSAIGHPPARTRTAQRADPLGHRRVPRGQLVGVAALVVRRHEARRHRGAAQRPPPAIGHLRAHPRPRRHRELHGVRSERLDAGVAAGAEQQQLQRVAAVEVPHLVDRQPVHGREQVAGAEQRDDRRAGRSAVRVFWARPRAPEQAALLRQRLEAVPRGEVGDLGWKNRHDDDRIFGNVPRFPYPMTLAGSGLRLREWTDADVPVMVELFDDAAVARWTPLASPFDEAAARAYLDRARARRAE